MRLQRECIVCGLPITHHHKYCEKHYPKKSALILNLKTEIKTLKKQIRKLENTIEQMKRSRNKK